MAGTAGVEPLEESDPPEVGPYTLLGRLGVGGMGSVYLGHRADGQPVAIKVIRLEPASDPDFRGRFLREVQAARRVAACGVTAYPFHFGRVHVALWLAA
ncbi:hypothetical protein [Pseudofrankia sp. DC12]|uniref:hypothetical protein n=1 Tax=Pseudofrankia sp. DC12 TaxID=683315 RepID=UPI0012F9DAE7|nr:hypothetical protein [Pseudofrankia sp. DC12]